MRQRDKLLARSGETGTVYGYAGEQFDAASSLVFLRARYYNPTLKLFMSRDPFPGWAGLPASQHGYSYAHNNPVNLTDPTGKNAALKIGVGLLLLYVGTTLAYPDIWQELWELGPAAGSIATHIADECLEVFKEFVDSLEEFFPNPEPEPETEPDEDEGTIDVYCDPSSPLCDDNDDGRKAAIIGAGAPVGLSLEQVKNIANAYQNKLIVNEPTVDWNLRKDRLDLEGLAGVQYHYGDAQELGPLNNTDIFAVAPNYGIFEPGILKELVEIADSIIGANSELYLAMDAGQANMYAKYVAADMTSAGYQGDLIMSWSRGTHSPPIIINGHLVNFISDFFDSNTGVNEQNRLIKIWR